MDAIAELWFWLIHALMIALIVVLVFGLVALIAFYLPIVLVAFCGLVAAVAQPRWRPWRPFAIAPDESLDNVKYEVVDADHEMSEDDDDGT